MSYSITTSCLYEQGYIKEAPTSLYQWQDYSGFETLWAMQAGPCTGQGWQDLVPPFPPTSHPMCVGQLIYGSLV